MWNANFNNMPTQTMQNQIMNFNETNLEDLIRPYQEKIRKLEDEISQKDFLITQLKFKLSQNNNVNKNNQQLINNIENNMNNQSNQNQMNMMNNNNFGNQMNMINNNNLANQMNMMNYNNFGNQMNMMNVPMNSLNNQGNQNNMTNNFNNLNNNVMINPMLQMGNNFMNVNNSNFANNMEIRNEVKFLNLKFIAREGPISIQCKSNEKMKDIINKFFIKYTADEKEYELFIEKKIKNENSTVEENGILDDKNYFINVIKKKQNVYNYINDNNNNDISQKRDNGGKIEEEISKNKSDIKILGTPILLFFHASVGSKISIKIGLNNTFKDAAIQFCQCLDIPTSVIGTHLIFLKNASKLDPFNDKVTIGQMGLENNNIITVIDDSAIIGA